MALALSTVTTLALGAPAAATAQEATAPTTRYTVKRGDTLWDIARSLLGDPFLWPEIYRLNRDVIEDPHWIYPGEVLAVRSGGRGEVPIAAAPGEPAPADVSGPTVFSPRPPQTGARVVAQRQLLPAPPAVRYGEAVAAPWVERDGGPRGAGRIMSLASLSGIPTDSSDTPIQLYDRVFVAPPTGGIAAEGERYLTYVLGPYLEEIGQIVVPTGIVEVTRAPVHGEAATARVIRAFGSMRPDQRLIPFDSAALIPRGNPGAATAAQWSSVRWVSGENLLPTTQSYLVLNITSRQGIKPGDQFLLFRPRRDAELPQDPALPEIPIARAHAVRVTPFATTVMVTTQAEPKIERGTMARVIAKMP